MGRSCERGVATVAIYDGFITLGDEEVHVILGVGHDRVTMSSNGSEIGEWPADEVAIDHAGEGTYTITAENESLPFVPNDPDLFAMGFGPEVPAARSVLDGDAITSPPQAPSPTVDDADAPAPKPVTRVAFYALAVVTVTLGLWAMVSMLLG